MADVTNRDAKEALISKPLSKEFSRFRIQLLSIIPGMDPWMMDIAPEFWVEHQAGLTAAISPVISGIYIAQAETMLDDFEIFGVDWGLANVDAADWAKQHTFDLVGGISNTSKKFVQGTVQQIKDWTNELQISISEYFEKPGTIGQLSTRLSGTFGTMRAEMIARTEVTRAASMGELQVSKYLAEQGIIMKHIWHTRNDELVCTLCGPKDEKEIGVEIEFGYPPEHPRCRCWWGQVLAPL